MGFLHYLTEKPDERPKALRTDVEPAAGALKKTPFCILHEPEWAQPPSKASVVSGVSKEQMQEQRGPLRRIFHSCGKADLLYWIAESIGELNSNEVFMRNPLPGSEAAFLKSAWNVGSSLTR